MKKSVEPLPRLDLAPKLNRPLSLWNPLDYLRLLYWVFYFPQALRWYVNTFGGGYIPREEMNLRKGWQILRENPIQRQLLIQGILLILTIPTSFCWFLEQFGFVIIWDSVAFGVAMGVVLGVAFGVAMGVVSGVGMGVVMGVAFSLMTGVDSRVANSVANGVGMGVVMGMVSGLVTGVDSGVANGVGMGVGMGVVLTVTSGVVTGVDSGVDSGVANGVAMGVGMGVAMGVAFGVAMGVAFGVAILRPDNWFVSTPANWLNVQNGSCLFPRVTVLPLPRLQLRLKKNLSSDWLEGLHNSNELLRYSYQFVPVVDAINAVLQQTPSEQLIWKTAHLADQPYDWKLVGFASISLQQQLKATFKRNLQSWRGSYSGITESPRLDTLPHATAAGFWYLHEKKTTHATEAFNVVRHILYGEEMYILALSLDLCTQAKIFNQIHNLTLPLCPERNPKQRLRQTSWPALEAFHRVTQETQLIDRSTGKATRAQALARAQGELKHILDNADQLPQAEGGLILDIATTWRDALLNIASDIGNVEILEPVQNPYTIGDPVEGDRFVGREDILRELESLWLGAANPPSVLIYGHRRMGKTSILRNLTGSSDLKLIYVNLQLLGSVTQGLSEVLLTIADDIAQHLDITAPPDDAFLTFPQRTFERYLRDVLKQLDCRALIIALDEFELIEDLIEAGQLTPDFMGYLRGLIQMDKRLAFALAGLHTLEEMTRDYFQPFFGSTYPLRVGFLSRAATRQILENPSDDFPLEYDPDAVDEIYRLTHGQPYLVQLIGFQLVRRFNELVFETPTFISTSLNERIPTPLNERSRNERNARLTLEDVAAVTDISQGDLFRNGRYYFDGIWNQASQDPPGQTDILQALAPHPTGLTSEELQSQCPDVPDLTAALDTLQRHDVVHQTEERWRIQVELCRRWIAARA
ncbi:AAA-like domain-containing protein [Roseofilum sp. Guam]|uniref:AAA family ATPase n=1 Tax=Roseofilum sp. Guam TaxID=2821502 RepID=UPI001B1807B8|nr:AAA-like domain-containing protein [Roseofilum sp. Guam]MBP0028428.1 AAA family ATPase [Roseofilum sp. Guam]